MASVVEHRIGVASGMVNLTRGLGTALGLSLTALVFDLASHGSQTPAATSRGYAYALGFLGLIAVSAGMMCLFRRPLGQERPVA